MSKKNFVTLVLGVVGVLLFGIGMCMCLLPEWNMFKPGVAVAAVGGVELLILLMVRRKLGGKPAVKVDLKTVGIVLYTLLSTLVLGVGMCLVLVWEMMLQGVVVGCVGIVLLLFLIPMVKGFK